MLYHAGKVFAVVPGEDTRATVEMWDENVFTFDIEEDLVDDIAEGDIVLVDYTPVKAGDNAVPRHTVVKILDDEQGRRVWERYQEFKANRQNAQTSAIQPSYMG